MRAGGDALASDLIWRELRVLAEKKPVIASMGDVAASGGPLGISPMSSGVQVIFGQRSNELLKPDQLLTGCCHALCPVIPL